MADILKVADFLFFPLKIKKHICEIKTNGHSYVVSSVMIKLLGLGSCEEWKLFGKICDQNLVSLTEKCDHIYSHYEHLMPPKVHQDNQGDSTIHPINIHWVSARYGSDGFYFFKVNFWCISRHLSFLVVSVFNWILRMHLPRLVRAYDSHNNCYPSHSTSWSYVAQLLTIWATGTSLNDRTGDLGECKKLMLKTWRKIHQIKALDSTSLKNLWESDPGLL